MIKRQDAYTNINITRSYNLLATKDFNVMQKVCYIKSIIAEYK